VLVFSRRCVRADVFEMNHSTRLDHKVHRGVVSKF
jgi:hypothetical protein